ncbi:MAG: hypothetical protein RR651_14975 [Lysinibacillus sp.]
MKIGRRVYYDKQTSNVILDTGERQGFVTQTTIEQDVSVYKVLSDRNRDTIDVIELQYGQYAQDFVECNGYRVNPVTKTLEFSYPDPNEPDLEPLYQEALSVKVASLEEQNTALMLAIAETAEAAESAKQENQLAIAELAEIVLGGAV